MIEVAVGEAQVLELIPIEKEIDVSDVDSVIIFPRIAQIWQ